MAQHSISQQTTPTPQQRVNHFSRNLLSLSFAALIFYVLRWSVHFMRSPEAPEQLVQTWYLRLGMEQAATTLQETGLNPLVGKLMITAVALFVGIFGIWALYWVANDLISRLPYRWREAIRPFIFVGPAILLLATFLIYPILNTLYTSISEDIVTLPEVVPEIHWASNTIAADLTATASALTFEGYLLNTDLFEIARVRFDGQRAWLIIRTNTLLDDETGTEQLVYTTHAIGLHNYTFALTSPDMHIAFRNNVLWLLFGTTFSVALGLLIATLVDRIKREAVAKSFIFLPLAISFVGASVIWRFVYAWQPTGKPQIGILNALVTRLGIDPIPWMIETPFNTFALIAIMVWLQTGFCMVILSAALKGVPKELIEASRIDGANEYQIFFQVIIPTIRGAIITVTTTVFIAILKVFDIVFVMTSGKFDTEVIANRMFVEMFNFRNFGRASSLAVILLLVVIPIMVINIRNLRQQGINQ